MAKSEMMMPADLALVRRYCPIIQMTDEVENRSGVTKEGKEYTRVSQTVFVRRQMFGVDTAEPAKVSLDSRNPVFYAPGFYLLSPAAYAVNQYGELGLKPFDRPLIHVAHPD